MVRDVSNCTSTETKLDHSTKSRLRTEFLFSALSRLLRPPEKMNS
jgi:hypothetical protein